MVVVPTILASPAEIQELIERLEVHYLANSDGEIHFAILSDWLDAASEQAPGDGELLAAAVSGIQRLNDLHGALPGGERRFFLFHRRRLWNEGEQKWMGWERKRGKLRELNRLLRGASDTTFLAVGGERPRAPENVRYVITLDADTRLPRRAACQLVSAMAHPLNRPRFDPATGSVIEGYGVLQPRVTSSLPTAEESSLFQRIFSGPAGIDPYAAAVSDVYQDLFHEGSYAGKGIYDIDAFEASLSGRVPENALLSHDLFEGLFARAGLASDIELFEEFPRHYEIAAARQHRWARGDWQLLPWILGHAEITSGDRARTPTALISEWKIVDNLRRSLSAPATILALLAAWTLPFADPLIWTAFILATIAIPALLPFCLGIIPRRRGISKRTHVRAVATDFFIASRAGDPRHCISRAPGLPDDRRDRANDRSPLHHTSAPPGVGHRGAGSVGSGRRLREVPCQWRARSSSRSAPQSSYSSRTPGRGRLQLPSSCSGPSLQRLSGR